MLSDLLHLTRPLICVDLETTGLIAESDRIIEIGFQVHKPDGAVDEWRSLVNPGVPIPEASTRVHHITDEMMKGCRVCGGLAGEFNENILKKHQVYEAVSDHVDPSSAWHAVAFKTIPAFAQIAAKLARGFSDCDFAGKNIRFDLSFLAAEFARAKVEWSYAGACVLDADRLEQLGDPRTLGHLVKKHLDEDMGSEAHTALGDVRWASKLIAAQLRAYEIALPRSLRKLHELSWPGWIDAAGRFKMRDGIPMVTFGKHRGMPMSAVPRDYWQWVAKNFDAEAAVIATNAMKGVFPK